jgi:iron complex transport system substrate-binding protein
MKAIHRIRLSSIVALVATLLIVGPSPLLKAGPRALTSTAASTSAAPQSPSRPTRIVSLIPAVTEMLFAMGAASQVVAVSSFDEYPPEVKKLPRVGALLDPDLERILALRPDLVIVYDSQTDFRLQLERAKVPSYVYKHAGLAGVFETMKLVGARVGRTSEATALSDRITAHLDRIRARVKGRPRPSTLVVFGRDALALRGIYASGGFGFLNDMLNIAGGENLFADVKRESVQATSELILARRPQVIVELRAGALSESMRAKEIAVWKVLPGVPAVRNKRITMVNDERTMVPGPRVAEGTELIARVLHPEAFAK